MSRMGRIRPLPGQFRAVVDSFPGTAEVEAGVYQVEIVLTSEWTGDLEETSAKRAEEEASACIFGWRCRKQRFLNTLIHTEWFHSDCLADYYHVEPFGERHWNVLEGQIRLAGELGINMLLAPVFTPHAGGRRENHVQLVNLVGKRRIPLHVERWCSLCREIGHILPGNTSSFHTVGAKAT